MSTSPNRASNSAGKPKRDKDVTLDLPTALQMLPLIRSIVSDIVDTHRRLNQLTPEQESLERNRRKLDWSDRQRRYSISDEIVQAEKSLAGAVSELSSLGVRLVDPDAGEVDFPTRINGKAAAFTWHPGDSAVGFWRYKGEEHRRPIPADWQLGVAGRYRAEP